MADEWDFEEEDVAVAPVEGAGSTDPDLGEDEWAFDEAQVVEDRGPNVMGDGLTLGFGPRIQALFETGSGFSDEYLRRKKEIERKNSRYRRANPNAAFAQEIIGSLPTALIPGMGAGRLAQAGTKAHTIARNLGYADRAKRAAGFGTAVGGVGSESAAMGAKMGAIYGYGSSRDDGFVSPGRLFDTATGSATGAATGFIGGKVAQPFARLADDLTMAGDMRGGERAALSRMNKELRDSDVSTSQLRTAAIPNMGNVQADDALLRQAMSSGGDPVQEYTRLMRAAGSMLGNDTLAGHVNRLQSRMNDRMPLAIDELASTIPSADGSRARRRAVTDTRRAVAMTPGEHQEGMINTVLNRQDDTIPFVRRKIDETLGQGDAVARRERLAMENREIANVMYSDARASETPFDLTDIFEEFHRTQPARGGSARDAIDDALRTMRGLPDEAGVIERDTLDTFIGNRSKLNDLINDSYRSNPNGTKSPTSATKELLAFKREIDKRVGDANPKWKTANDRLADGFSVERAIDDGRKMTIRGDDRHSGEVLKRVSALRTQRRSVVSKFNKLSKKDKAGTLKDPGKKELEEARQQLRFIDNQMEGYREGFGEVMHKSLNGLGDTHDPSKLFLRGGWNARTGPRNTIRKMMGEDSGNTFLDHMQDVKRAAQTTRSLSGSQTAEMQAKMRELGFDDEINAAADTMTLNPLAILRPIARAAAQRYGARRNLELGPMYNTMTDDPQAFFQMLQRLDDYSARSRAAFQPEGIAGSGVNAYAAPGVLTSYASRAVEGSDLARRDYNFYDDEEY